MLYNGKALPSWIKFRPKRKPSRIYTVPTRWEYQMNQMITRLWKKVAEDLLKQQTFFNDIKMSNGSTIRVRLPSSYSTLTKGTLHD